MKQFDSLTERKPEYSQRHEKDKNGLYWNQFTLQPGLASPNLEKDNAHSLKEVIKLREENSKLKEELHIAVEQVDTLSRVMEKLKLELDSKISKVIELSGSLETKAEEAQVIALTRQKQELEIKLSEIQGKLLASEKQIENYRDNEEKTQKLLDEVKTKCDLLESMRNNLANENQELHTHLNLKASKAENERRELKQELLTERSNHANQTKRFSEIIGTSQGILQQASDDLLSILTRYKEYLIPILESNAEIFGSELSRVDFPRNSVGELVEHPEKLLQWTNAFKEFMITLVREVNNIVRNTTILRTNSNEAKTVIDNLNKELQTREEEINKLKGMNKLLSEEKVIIHRKLKDAEECIKVEYIV